MQWSDCWGQGEASLALAPGLVLVLALSPRLVLVLVLALTPSLHLHYLVHYSTVSASSGIYHLSFYRPL